MRVILREPLLHFLALATVLFGLFYLVNGKTPDNPDARTLTVDRQALLTFLKFRAKSFDVAAAERRLDSMSAEERARLEREYIEEEALYREALNLGMDRDDYVIKLRLVQKMRFLAEGFSEQAVSVSEAGIAQYFADHRRDYYIEPSITFTHVFFNVERRGWPASEAQAAQTLAELRTGSVAFDRAARYGDRFHYYLNYVERTPDYIRSHFGSELSQAVFATETPVGEWVGPLRSPYGLHLLLVTKRSDGRDVELDEVRDRVAVDARQQALKQKLDAAVEAIVSGYTIERPAES